MRTLGARLGYTQMRPRSSWSEPLGPRGGNENPRCVVPQEWQLSGAIRYYKLVQDSLSASIDFNGNSAAQY